MNILTPTEISECLTGGPTTVARAIESEVIAKLAAGVSVEPVAHVKFWAAQHISPDGGVEADEGLEVCRPGEIGMDGVAAEPVFTLSQLQTEIAAARVQENERCAKVCEGIADEYQRRDGHKFPELKDDAQTGASSCEAAIRALIGGPK